MKDKFEKFVQENREEFDVFEPRQELWQQICQQLPPPAAKKEAKVISINFGERASFRADFMFMRVAAAVLLLLGCGLTLLLTKQNTPANAIAATEQVRLNNIAPELAEVEAYYTSQINSKKGQLSAYNLKVLGLDEEHDIEQELARLDRNYAELKKQLYTTPNTDKVMDAMIRNLQLRIMVLNRQLEVLEKIEKLQKTETSEPGQNETQII
ncbi:hypothetical protein [Botryobacter ruber]|uniref:hypothetical protein n=1 Tax=Botryobacter ruber TaxID=2171629 RepID=UPI000E0B2574|nr:hypothetical protein [Botryobacter ruber]